MDDIFKCTFVNENVWISIKISLKFVPNGPINNMPALAQIMACQQSGDKPLSKPMMVSLLMHMCITQPHWVELMYCIAYTKKIPKFEDTMYYVQLMRSRWILFNTMWLTVSLPQYLLYPIQWYEIMLHILHHQSQSSHMAQFLISKIMWLHIMPSSTMFLSSHLFTQTYTTVDCTTDPAYTCHQVNAHSAISAGRYFFQNTTINS